MTVEYLLFSDEEKGCCGTSLASSLRFVIVIYWILTGAITGITIWFLTEVFTPTTYSIKTNGTIIETTSTAFIEAGKYCGPMLGSAIWFIIWILWEIIQTIIYILAATRQTIKTDKIFKIFHPHFWGFLLCIAISFNTCLTIASNGWFNLDGICHQVMTKVWNSLTGIILINWFSIFFILFTFLCTCCSL